MPKTDLVIFREADGSVPLVEWLEALPDRAKAKCFVRIERLADCGHALRRPEADYLQDGIYELRVALSGVHYRILYFFYGRTTAVLSHGLIKKGARMSLQEIQRAIQRKRMFEANTSSHTRTYMGEVSP